MPVTVTLSTMPAHLTRTRHGLSRTTELFGDTLGRETISTVSTVADLRAAVARFGAATHAKHPEASFVVSVVLAKGQRKPNGYDAACRNGGLGQDDYIRVQEDGTESLAAPPMTPAGERHP